MAKIILNVDLNSAGASADIKKLKADLNEIGNPSGAKNIDSLRKSYANLINTIQGSEKNYAKGTFSKIAEEAKKYLDEVKKLDPATADYAKQSKHLDDELKRLQADFAETRTGAKNLHGSLKDIVSGFMKFQLAATLVMKPLQLMKNAYDDLNETLVETEKRIVALRRVAGDSANATALYDLAQKYGQTFDIVADVVENLVKSGYTWEESLKAAEPALLAINVAELDAAQATEGLIAIVKQYEMELEDLNYIQGVLNKTADNAAVTTEKLLIALQKTGSTAKNANIDFEETVGLITALSEGTAASGQNIGNALRSLIVFTSDSKALDSFAGLSSGMAETVKNYRAGRASILDIWKGLGGELQGMNSQKGTLEDLFGGAELTADIEAQLTQITDSFAEIYGTAGNYRQNYFIALLDNIAKVEDATKDLGDATTYSQKENQKYLDTYEAKANALDAKWKQIANDEQGFLAFKKGMIDVASDLLTAVDAVGGLGGLLNATIAILTPFLLKWTFTFGVSAISAAKAGIVSFFTSMKTGALSANASLGLIGVALAGISLAISAAQAETEKWHESNQKAISDWESIKEETAALDALYKEYQQLTPEAKEYAEVEKELVTALGDKAVVLEGLTKGTDDYREAVKRLAKEELEDAKIKYSLASQAAKDELVGTITPDSTFSTGKIQFKNTGAPLFDGTGIVFTDQNRFSIDGLKNGKTPEEVIYNLNKYKESVAALYNLAYAEGNEENRDSYLRLIGVIQAEIDAISPKVDAYNNTKDSLDLVLERLKEIADETEKTEGNVSNINNDLSNLNDTTLKGIVDKLREARDATKDTYEYEEKKKAVLEAEKALMDAQKNRTTRVLNSATGQWEWVANERDIQAARENLEEARLAVEEAAYSQIISDLESGNATNKSILALLASWQGAYGSGDFSHVSDGIKAILREAGVNVDAPTSQDIGDALLSPQPHEKYLENIKKYGLLGGSVRQLMEMSGSTIFNNQRTSSDSHNTYINGVQIGASEAKRAAILELFKGIPLFDDNNFLQ